MIRIHRSANVPAVLLADGLARRREHEVSLERRSGCPHARIRPLARRLKRRHAVALQPRVLLADVRRDVLAAADPRTRVVRKDGAAQPELDRTTHDGLAVGIVVGIPLQANLPRDS